MGHSAVREVASLHRLKIAWQDTISGKKNKASYLRIGIDGMSLEAYGQSLDKQLAKLRRDLLSNSYQFQSLEPVFIPKPNGKDRLICVPVVRDRIVQRTILNFLRPHNGWMANGLSFGFVPDITLDQAIAQTIKLRGQLPWVFKTDITSFFDMIQRDKLCERINKRVKHPTIRPLLLNAIDCEIEAKDKAFIKRLKQTNIRTGRGVRQGMPLSPYFANVFLEPFDAAVLKAGYQGVRYADDLAFFASSEDKAKEIEAFCVEQLNGLGLEIPALSEGGKTKIFAPDEAAEFLGLEVVRARAGEYEVRVSSDQMNKIKERLYQYKNISQLRKKNLSLARFGNALDTAIASYQAHYENCINIDDLNDLLESCKKNVISDAMKSLGVNVNALDDDGRWFLGLDAPRPL